MEPEEFRTRINFLINTKQLSIAQLCEITNLSRSTITSILGRAGKFSRKLPSANHVVHILKSLEGYPVQVYAQNAPVDSSVALQYIDVLKAKRNVAIAQREHYISEVAALEELIMLNEAYVRREHGGGV